jgi:hypothetical protein
MRKYVVGCCRRGGKVDNLFATQSYGAGMRNASICPFFYMGWKQGGIRAGAVAGGDGSTPDPPPDPLPPAFLLMES